MFCHGIDPTGRILKLQGTRCEGSLPAPHACALQNLTAQHQWVPKVLDFSPEKIARAWSAQLKEHGTCRLSVLDFEMLPARDRHRFPSWLRSFRRALTIQWPNHPLAIALHAKTSEPGSWSGAIAQDAKRLCEEVQEAWIMAYDHTPGERVAPTAWTHEVLNWARSVCPLRKIRLGLASYGYTTHEKRTRVLRERELLELPPLPSIHPLWKQVETEESRLKKRTLAQTYGVFRFFTW
jgi:hypothetical protein